MKQIKEGYKQTKVGIIPEDWEVVKIGEKFEFIKSYSNSRADLTDIDEISYIHYGEIHKIHKFYIDFEKFQLPKINQTKLSSEIVFAKNGDLVIADASEDYADIGKSAEIKNLTSKAVSGLHTFLLRDKKNNFADGYKGYLLYNETVAKSIKKIATGISVLGISKTNLSNLEIPLPPLKEQEKIAQILTIWDNAIIKQQELIKSKEEQKKGLMQRLLIGEVRFDGFSDEWKEVTIDELFTFKKGQALSKEKLDEKGIFECILYGELYTTYSEIIKEIKSKTNIEEGIKSKVDDILIPASTTTTAIDLAIASVVQKENVLIGGDINILRKKINNINGEFIAKYLTHIKKIEIAKYAQGITIIHLYSKDFKHLKINLPSLFEQQKIAEVLSLADEEINNLKNELKEQKQQKKALMQKLLTGQVRVNV